MLDELGEERVGTFVTDDMGEIIQWMTIPEVARVRQSRPLDSERANIFDRYDLD